MWTSILHCQETHCSDPTAILKYSPSRNLLFSFTHSHAITIVILKDTKLCVRYWISRVMCLKMLSYSLLSWEENEVWCFQLICLFLVWCQVALLGIDIVSAFVDRLTDRFRGYIGTGKRCLLLVPLIHNISKAALAKDLFHCIISRKGNARGLAMYMTQSQCLSLSCLSPAFSCYHGDGLLWL